VRRARGAHHRRILTRIAVVFGVSADELVFENGSGPAAHKLDAELLQRFGKTPSSLTASETPPSSSSTPLSPGKPSERSSKDNTGATA